MINLIELNVILYYADFLSLRDISIPVTDNCKYYFIYGAPMNSAYIVDLKPFYDTENKYYIEAYTEYTTLKDKFGEDAVLSFVDKICNLAALGTVNAEQMLQCIHQYSSKQDKKNAYRAYFKWKNNQKYTHQITDDNGDTQTEECTRFVAHVDETARVRYTEEVGDGR